VKALVLAGLIAGAAWGPDARAAEKAREVRVEGPRRATAVVVRVESGRLRWNASLRGRPVIEDSPLGIVVDGVDLGEGAVLGRTNRYRAAERFPWRGVHSEAFDPSRGARVAVRHAKTGLTYFVQLRAFDDAVAFQLIVPGTGRRVPDAATRFRLPAGSTVWYHGLRDHYEGAYTQKAVAAVSEGEWAAPPLSFALPGGGGYGAITEAALAGYAGMVLQADGQGGFAERLGHAPPASYPFVLRYKEDEARRLSAPAAIDGTIATPWRLVLMGDTLDALVNSDAIASLSPPPDPKRFPQGMRTPWIRPGRALWRYLDGGENTLDGIKEFSRLAGELGFEYNLVEGLWQKWSDAELCDLVEYSKGRGVGVWLWRHSNTLHKAEERRALFAKLHDAGVVGVKVDFLDHEAKEVIDHYQDILRDAAEFQLMVDFHGANKPAGEARTWPNEMTREGIRGLEHRSMEAWATHDTTWPFTRLLAGHADFTPVVFGQRRKETSWAHQVASAVIVTSPLLVYGAHPASILSNPAADVIRSIPSVWDETRVLPASRIGELALFARRSGTTWFVAAMNGPSARTVKVDLAFLGAVPYRAVIVRDEADDPAAVEMETRSVRARDVLELPMRAGGGLVIRLAR
jgi:alpha-glucosidase